MEQIGQKKMKYKIISDSKYAKYQIPYIYEMKYIIEYKDSRHKEKTCSQSGKKHSHTEFLLG